MIPFATQTILLENILDQLEKDRATVEAIGRIYCKRYHREASKDVSGLCESCRRAVDLTVDRAQACPNNHEENCEDCAIKCQRGDDQKRIKEIMRYSAPRMLVRHPLMTIEYLRKKLR